VDDVGAAILLAQAVVGRPSIEDERALILGRVGDLEQRVGRQIDDEVAHALVDKRPRRGCGVVVRAELDVLDRERLVEELAGRVVVGHRHPGAGDELVGGRDIEDRDRLARMLDAQDADLDLERIGVGREGQGQSYERERQQGCRGFGQALAAK
jgi:hypothetical protein